MARGNRSGQPSQLGMGSHWGIHFIAPSGIDRVGPRGGFKVRADKHPSKEKSPTMGRLSTTTPTVRRLQMVPLPAATCPPGIKSILEPIQKLPNH
jgi:hypothetical protein